jgi:hypothetical protein
MRWSSSSAARWLRLNVRAISRRPLTDLDHHKGSPSAAFVQGDPRLLTTVTLAPNPSKRALPHASAGEAVPRQGISAVVSGHISDGQSGPWIGAGLPRCVVIGASCDGAGGAGAFGAGALGGACWAGWLGAGCCGGASGACWAGGAAWPGAGCGDAAGAGC